MAKLRRTVEETDDLIFAALAEAERLPADERADAFMRIVVGSQVLLKALPTGPKGKARPAYPTTPEERLRARQTPSVVAARALATKMGVTDDQLDADLGDPLVATSDG
jgi:hypothetical protein